MKLKGKLLAGVLSLATLASMLPQVAMANTTQLTEGASVEDSYKYWFNVDFDEMTTETIPDSLKMEEGVERWTQTIEDGAMKFTLTPESSSGDQTLLNLYPNALKMTSGSQTKDNNYGAYEIGYKIKLNGIKSDITKLFTSTGKASYNLPPWKEIKYVDGFINTRLGTERTAESDNDKLDTHELPTAAQTDYIDVKYYYRTGNRHIKMTYVLGETEYTIADYELNAPASTLYDAIGNLYLAVDDTGVTASESFYIDDLYLRTIKQETYKVTFVSYGTTTVATKTTNSFDKAVTLPSDPTRTGYVFDGWYNDNDTFEDEFDPNNVTSTKTVYAKWIDIHKVTFNPNGGKFGTSSANKTVWSTKDSPDSIADIMPDEPTKTRAEFVGWYEDIDVWEKPFDGTGLTGDITVYAKWETAYEISFDTTGGDSLDPVYTTDTIELDKLPEAVRTGYRFDGWYRDEACTIPFDGKLLAEGETEKQDITIYAKWTQKWKIEFDVRGGNSVDAFYTLSDVEASELPEATMQGGGFVGWYWDKEYTKPFDGSGIESYMNSLPEGTDKVLTVYAKWDNTILYIDFESESDVALGNDIIKQLAPINYDSLMQEGYGVVEDGRGIGNHALRIAYEGMNVGKLKFPGGNGGDGLYEISFKVNLNGSRPKTYNVISPSLGDKVQLSTYLDNGLRFSGNAGVHGVFVNTTESLAKDYFTFRYLVNTISNEAKIFGQYTNITTNAVVSASGSTTFNEIGAGVDGLWIWKGYYTTSNATIRTDYYIDEIIVKKIDMPKLSSAKVGNVSLENAEDIPLNPEIELTFTQLVDASTVNKNNIKLVSAEGANIDLSIESDTGTGVTVASITPLTTLLYDTEYTLTVSTGIAKGDYNLEKAYSYTFLTEPNKFKVRSSLQANGEDVTDISERAGKNVDLKLEIENYTGKETEKYFVSAALIDTTDNKQVSYIYSEGELTRDGKLNTVLTGTFTIPSNATEGRYIIKYFIWDTHTDRNALWEFIEYK